MPKPMLPIGKQPILAYNLAMLASGGFEDILINLHALPGVVRDYVGDGSAWGVRVTYNEERELLGTAGALVPSIDTFAHDTFAIVFGDNVVELDLCKMLEFHRSRNADVTIAVWERADVDQSGVAELDEADRVVRFIEKPRAGQTSSRWVNVGVIIAEPRLLDAIPRNRPSDLGRDILPALIDVGARIFGYPVNGGHWWFDRTEDYLAALADPRLARFIERSATRNPKDI